MKVLKVLGWVLLAVVAFVALSIWFTSSNLNAIVKQAVEQVGSESLHTKVTLNAADVSLSESRARLSGLTIHNPPGFAKPNLFELDDVNVDLNLQAIVEKTVDLKDVTIKGLRIVVEQKGTTTNVQTLLDNLPSTKQPEKKPEAEKTGGEPLDLLVKVRKFQFVDSAATLVTEKWGEQKLALPPVILNNIGGDKGVPPDQFAQAVIKPLLKQVNRAARDKLKGMVEDKAKEALKKKEDELKDKYRSKLEEKTGGSLKSLLSK